MVDPRWTEKMRRDHKERHRYDASDGPLSGDSIDLFDQQSEIAPTYLGAIPIKKKGDRVLWALTTKVEQLIDEEEAIYVSSQEELADHLRLKYKFHPNLINVKLGTDKTEESYWHDDTKPTSATQVLESTTPKYTGEDINEALQLAEEYGEILISDELKRASDFHYEWRCTGPDYYYKGNCIIKDRNYADYRLRYAPEVIKELEIKRAKREAREAKVGTYPSDVIKNFYWDLDKAVQHVIVNEYDSMLSLTSLKKNPSVVKCMKEIMKIFKLTNKLNIDVPKYKRMTTYETLLVYVPRIDKQYTSKKYKDEKDVKPFLNWLKKEVKVSKQSSKKAPQE